MRISRKKFQKSVDNLAGMCYNKSVERGKTPKEMKVRKMTVREVLEMLMACDPDATVVPCDWGEEGAVRVWDSHGFHEVRGTTSVEDEEE